jgi:uncharacterized protein with GYD domain
VPTYIRLHKLTDQGVKNIKDAPYRIEESIKNVETKGIKFIDFYAVMGEYDYISIVEGPSDDLVMTATLRTISKGDLRTTTLRAFTQQEFAGMLRKIPSAYGQ